MSTTGSILELEETRIQNEKLQQSITLEANVQISLFQLAGQWHE